MEESGNQDPVQPGQKTSNNAGLKTGPSKLGQVLTRLYGSTTLGAGFCCWVDDPHSTDIAQSLFSRLWPGFSKLG
jgi:hypothetical protein